MYSRPTVSTIRLPRGRATKNGSPPTEPKARTGELTPPGIRAWARANQSEFVICSQRFGELAREVGENHLRARALDREQVLEGNRRAVDPSELGRGLDHRVLA